MRRICVVQARTGSSRLPGKVLAEVGGRPLLALMLRRLAPLPVDEVVVATSDAPSDELVASLGEAEGVAVVRGDERDVLSRFVEVLAVHPADVVVRLTADCPFVDWRLVAAGLEAQERTGADHVSNVLVRTYPDGLDFEVVRAPVLQEAGREARAPAEREHVTPFVYRRPERYRLAAVREQESLADQRWTVDTAEDLGFVRAVASRLSDPVEASWQDVLTVAGLQPAPPVRWRPSTLSDPFLPPGLPLDDCGRRVWVAEGGTGALGWAQVDVRAGEGILRACWLPGGAETAAQAETLLRALLRLAWPQCAVLTAPLSEVPESWATALRRHGARENNNALLLELEALPGALEG